MNDWRTIKEIDGMSKSTTIIELIKDKLPDSLIEKKNDEFRILYPEATGDAIYYLSVCRDEDERLSCSMFHVGALGTKNQTEPILIPSDSNTVLKQAFRLLQCYLSGEHYRWIASERDIVLKIMPLDSDEDEIQKLMNELKAQLAIDLL